MIQRLFSLPLMSLLLTACVTINIYFPAAAAEEAARTIVREALGAEQPPAQPSPPQKTQPATDDKQSLRVDPAPPALLFAEHVLNWLVPAAHAAGEADININTPAISRLRASMSRRSSALAPYYRSGAIGFDRNGLVAVRDLKAVPLKERGRLRSLVADENRDRNALYREIARANGHPEWEADIRKTFARVWVEEAYAGYWYQDANGGWRRK